MRRLVPPLVHYQSIMYKLIMCTGEVVNNIEHYESKLLINSILDIISWLHNPYYSKYSLIADVYRTTIIVVQDYKYIHYI